MAVCKFYMHKDTWLPLGVDLGIDNHILQRLNDLKDSNIEKLHAMFMQYFKNHKSINNHEILERDIVCSLNRVTTGFDFHDIGHFLNSNVDSELLILMNLPFLRDGDFRRLTSQMASKKDMFDLLTRNIESSDWFMIGLLLGLDYKFLMNVKCVTKTTDCVRIQMCVDEWLTLKSTHPRRDSVVVAMEILKEFKSTSRPNNIMCDVQCHV